MPSKILKEVAAYCWSNNFLEHASVFESSPPMTNGEHNMMYYELFQIYLKLYESTLESYLKTIDVTISEFYQDVRDAQTETDDPYLLTFIDCLLASADYESFYKVMHREGAKSLARKSSQEKSKTKSIDMKSDSKSNNNLRDVDVKGGNTDVDDHKTSADDKYSHK